MRKTEEFAVKIEKVERLLDQHELAGVVLSRTDNFAWLGCGADNSVVTCHEAGVGTLVVRHGVVTLVANNIEAERLLTEELEEVDIPDTEVFPWHRPEEKEEILRDICRGARMASDDGSAGLPALPPEFDRLRYVLTGSEIERYKALGRDCTCAIEGAARAVEPGMTEAEIAGLLSGRLREAGISPVVLLVAADERIENWRHPVPKDALANRRAMLVTCGRRQGLIAAITRLVHFGEPGEELSRRHRAVCRVDAAMILATVPGRKASHVLEVAQEAYAENGFPDQWQLHHQGGATGYRPREYLVTPEGEQIIHAEQAFGWNPSIAGTKSEDTILAGEEGVAFLTAPSEDWPAIRVECEGQVVERPDILVK